MPKELLKIQDTNQEPSQTTRQGLNIEPQAQYCNTKFMSQEGEKEEND
jgi:hypothetical protein